MPVFPGCQIYPLICVFSISTHQAINPNKPPLTHAVHHFGRDLPSCIFKTTPFPESSPQLYSSRAVRY